ncbi:MAG: hypothetical protein ACTSYA_10980 [Candidatus Kariarchaeaceae archaeon]
MLTKKSDTFSKLKHILCWSESSEYVPPPSSKSILYRFPNKQLKDLSSFTELGIAKSEICFIYSQGKLDGPYHDGLYEISPKLLNGGSTLFFISTAPRKWKIKVPEDIERSIGANVDLSQFTASFRVSNPKIFLTRGLDYSWEIDTEKAFNWVESLIVSSLGDISRVKSPEDVVSLMNDASRNQELISLIQSELVLMGVAISELSTGATILDGALDNKAISSIGVASTTIMRELEKLDDAPEEAAGDLLKAMSSVKEVVVEKAQSARRGGKSSKAKKKEKKREEVEMIAKADIPPPSPSRVSAPKSAPAPPSPPGSGAPPAKVVRMTESEEPTAPSPPSPMPVSLAEDVSLADEVSLVEETYEEEYDEFDEDDVSAEGSYEYETTIIQRETMISYYERMHIWKTFPLEVIISSEEIRATVVKNIARVKSKLEVEVEADEKPIVRIVPIFPGCLISPNDAFVDLDDDFSQTVFYLTPTTLGKHKARIEFWKDEYKIGEEEIDLKVVKTRLAKISLTAGFASLIPNVSTAIGYDMNSAAEESISSKNDVLSEVVTTFGGMMIFLFTLFIFFSSMSGLIFYLLRPKKDETSLSIF